MKAQTLSNPRVSIPYLLTYLTSLIEIFLYQFILPFDCHLLMQRSAKWDPRKNPPSIIGLSQTLDSLTWSVHPTYWWRVASQIIWLLVVPRVSSTGNCTHCLPSIAWLLTVPSTSFFGSLYSYALWRPFCVLSYPHSWWALACSLAPYFLCTMKTFCVLSHPHSWWALACSCIGFSRPHRLPLHAWLCFCKWMVR